MTFLGKPPGKEIALIYGGRRAAGAQRQALQGPLSASGCYTCTCRAAGSPAAGVAGALTLVHGPDAC